MSSPPQRVNIRIAAKAIGKSRDYVLRLIEDEEVRAYRQGGGYTRRDGTRCRPWLAVDLDELGEAHDRLSLYVPGEHAEQRKRVRRRPSGVLNPAAAAM